ncbi:phage tail protein [Candidatus Bipolaricaulota bacterium]
MNKARDDERTNATETSAGPHSARLLAHQDERSEGGNTMAEPFIGEIRMVGFQYAPMGWADADGQLLPIQEHAALYSLYGTLYGGDGRTTFALPNLMGRVPIHVGRGPGLPDYYMGQAGGYPAVPLSQQQMPNHSHTATTHAAATTGDQVTPEGHYWAEPQRAAYLATKNATMAADAVEIAEAGGGQMHENMPPFLTIRFCVSLEGIFPQRP